MASSQTLFALALVLVVGYVAGQGDNETATVEVTTAAASPSEADNTEGEEAKKLTCFLCNTFTPGKEDDGKMCKDEWNKTIEAEVQTCEGTVCRKYIQKVGKDIDRIWRGCGDELEPILVEKKVKSGCIFSTGTTGVQLEICDCVEDKCNGAVESRSALSVLLSAGLLAILVQLLH